MWVKICANTNLEDAALAAELGADAVGFVFAPSKRRVNAEQVAAITKHLPASVEKVGVFHGDDAEEIVAAVREAGLTAVQLHGALNAALVEAVVVAFEGRVKVIQTVRCAVDGDAGSGERFEDALVAALLNAGVWAVLLDAAKAGVSGGLGVAFDWGYVAPLVRKAYARAVVERELPKLIVAGGLRAENVAEAIAEFVPWGVDVASGVEASYGKKDVGKLREFLAAARGTAS